MSSTGVGCSMMILLSAVCGFALPCLMGMEVASKKKTQRKQEEELESAKFRTMVSALAALKLGFGAMVVYLGVSASSFSQLQNTGYFPFPGASWGIYIGWFAISLQVCTAYCAVTRVYPNPLFGGGGEKEEEETDGQGADALQGQAGFGAFPPNGGGGFGGGMGAPMFMDAGMPPPGGMPPLGGLGPGFDLPPLGMPPGPLGPGMPPGGMGAGPGYVMPALSADHEESPFPPM